MKNLSLLFAMLATFTLAACGERPAEQPTQPSEHAAADPKGGDIEVKLCDNHTTTTVSADAAPSRDTGQKIADSLMAKWKAAHPDQDWEAEERKSRVFLPAADNSALLAEDTQAPGHPYRSFTQQHIDTWKRETETFAVAGSKVFHSGDELGSTIAVSCDMCHPNAANTHPETYPKFQTQLGRVVLLRDMINWCLEHPVRAKPMDADDPRMRAMEAYIISQRAGATLAYGKH
jgi:thiosulfate dehydrogenase